VSASEVARPPQVVLDGDTLTPAAVALVARRHARVALAPAARERNDRAAQAARELIERGAPLYGASTGVGALSGRGIAGADLEGQSLRLLRSHAAGGGRPLRGEIVRAAMVVRANQVGAGGAGIAGALLDALVLALNADLVPVAHELGSLGTGDLPSLAEIALALLGEGDLGRAGAPADGAAALREAGIGPIRLGARDGLAFMSSNAVTAGRAALLAFDAASLLDAWLAVAALSFEAIGADPVVFDGRVHAGRRQPGPAAVAERMRALLAGARRDGPARLQYPYPFRVQPQVDGATHDALRTLERAVEAEVNLAGENPLIVAAGGVALPNGNFDAASLAAAIDGLRLALAASGALIAARVSALLDPNLSGLPAFLAREPGPDSGAMMLEYTAHDAAAEVRSLAMPVAAQAVSVARGVESHASLAPTAARRAEEALAAMRVLVATELVIAVRAVRLGGAEPSGAGSRELFERAAERLDGDLGDRPLHPDLAAACALIEHGPAADQGVGHSWFCP
jgi:histidine ammonia-lyase